MKNPGPPSQGADRWAGSGSKSNDLRLLFRGKVPGPGTDNLLGQMLDTTQLPEEQLAQRLCNGMAHSGYCGLGPWQRSNWSLRVPLQKLPHCLALRRPRIWDYACAVPPTPTPDTSPLWPQVLPPVHTTFGPEPLGQELPHCDGEGVLHSRVLSLCGRWCV